MGTFIFRVLAIGSSRVKIDVFIITLKSPGKLNKISLYTQSLILN